MGEQKKVSLGEVYKKVIDRVMDIVGCDSVLK